MTTPEHIVLRDWDEFAPDLRRRLQLLGFKRLVLVRNFAKDRLPIVLETGTDRDDTSSCWQEEHFDFDGAHPDDVTPSRVLYAHRLDHFKDPFQVLNLGEEYTAAEADLTVGLTQNDGVLIYDSAGFRRVAINEHWCQESPLSKLLLVYTVADPDADNED